MSNDIKHTPGPWMVSNTDRWNIVDAKGIKLCDCYFSNDVPIVAAAPDMLEALKETKYRLEYGDFYKTSPLLGAIIDQIKSAIAKAEGKQ